jgi:hypothetical protein
MRKSMATRPKKPAAPPARPSDIIRWLIPPNDRGRASLPQDLPDHVWARFFAVAFDRLHRANPGWAEVTLEQFRAFSTSWQMAISRREWDERARWIAAAFRQVEATRFGRGEFKRAPDRRRHVLMWAQKDYRGGLLPLDDPRIHSASLPGLKEHHREVAAARGKRGRLTYASSRSPLTAYLDVLSPPRKRGRPRRSQP